MSRQGRRTGLSAEDDRLWKLVTRTVVPRSAPVVEVRTTEDESRQASERQLVAIPKKVAKPPHQSPSTATSTLALSPQALTPFRIGEAVKAPGTGYSLTRAASARPDPIEPRRKRRITRERDPIEARIDLHGHNQFAAEDRLKAFITQAWLQGLRAVLVITGKGPDNAGVIRQRTPEWLASADLAPMIAGFSEAHARHGGGGALYVALKRNPGQV